MKVIDIRNILQGKTKRPPEPREVKSLGVTLWFKRMSGMESDAAQVSTVNPDTGKVDVTRLKGYRARVVASCLVDEDGVQLYPGAEGIEEVGTWDNDILAELNDICRDLNKLGKEDVDKEVKD